MPPSHNAWAFWVIHFRPRGAPHARTPESKTALALAPRACGLVIYFPPRPRPLAPLASRVTLFSIVIYAVFRRVHFFLCVSSVGVRIPARSPRRYHAVTVVRLNCSW
jgi:hypothetical protein